MAAPTTLFLPVWAQVRELDAKILLACAAAERGIPAILGSRAPLTYYAHRLPRGTYLAKGGQNEGRFFRILGDLGHDVALLDEASLLRLPDEEVRARRYSEKAASRVALFLAWGDDDARMLRETPSCQHAAVCVTGNPRMDLTRPELRPYFAGEARALREHYGEFALLNTNFFGLNHYLPALSTEREVAEGKREASAYYQAFARHRARIFDAFIALVPEIARAIAPSVLIVRPHPMESPEAWRRAADGLDNVHIRQDGNVLTWLLAASLSIANNCTTLVESNLLGKTGVHFEPVRDPALDFALPRLVSHRAQEPAEVVSLAAQALRGALAPREGAPAQVLRAHLAGLDGEFASDRIAQAVLDHARKPRGAPPLHRRWLGAAQNIRRALKKQRGGDDSRHDERLHEHRFPPLADSAVRERVARFAALLGRFEKLSVERISEHLFRIAPG
jgi:surface carbohydrate biosynthesis protein